MLGGCSNGEKAPIPRRTGYPRVPEYEDLYTAVDSLPLHILANRDAEKLLEHKSDGTYWLTIGYPLYNAKVYCTLTPVDISTVQKVIDNRSERIGLNTRGASVSVKEIIGKDGYRGALIEDAHVSATPLQFMTVDSKKAQWVVTGTAFLNGITEHTKADSISPIIATLRRDMIIMLDSIGNDDH